MQFATLLAIPAFLATSLNLVASAPVVPNAAADWKPDPAACALCPRAFEALDNPRAFTRYPFTDLFADAKGLCREGKGWKEPGEEYKKHCRHLLGDAPVETIRGPPWGDGAVPVAGHDPNHVWGPNVPDKVYDICGVNGTEFRGKPLIDRKCLRSALEEREDAMVKSIEPCSPCSEVPAQAPDPYDWYKPSDYPPCWECCTENRTIDRVCWLKMNHPMKTVMKQKVDDHGNKFTVTVGDPNHKMTPQEFVDKYDPGRNGKRSEIAKRQLLPPPIVDRIATDCGNWTEPSGEQHATPTCDCEKLYTNFYGYHPAKPNPFSDRYLPLLAEEDRPLHTMPPPYHAAEVDPKLPCGKRSPQSGDRQAFMNLKHLHCGNWTEPSGDQHPIPSHFCMNYMVELIEQPSQVLDCDPVLGECTDVGAALELQRCGNWTQALSVQPPSDVKQCLTWVAEYRDWVDCLHQPRLMIDRRRCYTPAFLADDGDTSSNATGNEPKILPRDASWPPLPKVRHNRLAHCGNWTDFLNATHVIPERVCGKLNLKLVNTMYPLPPFPGRGPSSDAADVSGDVSAIDGEMEILPRDTPARPPADPLEFPLTHCGNWTDFRNGTHPIPGRICRRLNNDLLLFHPPFPFPGPVAYGEHPRGPIGVAENENKLDILPRDAPPLNETKMLEAEDKSELERCRTWTQSLGARTPTSVEQCHAWELEYYQWENCKSEPWLTPFPDIMCPAPSFFYDDDGNIIETVLQKVVDILPRDAPAAPSPSEGSAYRCQDKDGNWHRHFAQCLDHPSDRLPTACQDKDGHWHSDPEYCSLRPSDLPYHVCQDKIGIWHNHIKYCVDPLDSGHHDKQEHEHHDPANAPRSLSWSCTGIVDGKRVTGHRLPDGGCDLETHDPHMAMPIEEVPGPVVYEEEGKYGDGDPFTSPPMPYPAYRHDFGPMIKFPDEEDKPRMLPEDATESDS